MSTTPARRSRKPRSSTRSRANLAPAPDPAEPVVVSIPDLFRKGRTIAQIARAAQVGKDVVRTALDEAGLDYSTDKEAKPIQPRAVAKAAPRAKAEWSLLASYEAVLAKKTAGSKRALVIADLASDANTTDLQRIALQLAAVDDRHALAEMANALNAALSAHYARV